MPAGRFEGADGIRGLACLMVLFAHIPGFFIPDAAKYFSGTGKYGVWLFFVLSAFLLTVKFQRSGFSVGEISKYALGRFLRIIPLFLLVILIYWYFDVLIHTSDEALKAVTFQQGYGHLWTIPVEFKYYALLPFFAFLFVQAKMHGGNVAVFLLTISLTAAHQLIWSFWNTPDNSISTRWYIPCFLVGSHAAVSMDVVRKHVTPAKATTVAMLTFLSLLALSPGGRNWLFDMPFDGWLQNKFLLLSFIWGIFLVYLADGKGAIGTMLKARVFRLLGAWSYSVYLIHWLVYSKVSATHQGSMLWAGASLIGAVACGAVLYYLVESPIERSRHSLAQTPKAKKHCS